MSSYRTGRKLGRTIYHNEQFMGIMDRPDDALLVVQLLNSPHADLLGQLNDVSGALVRLLGAVDRLDPERPESVFALREAARFARTATPSTPEGSMR